MTRVGSPLLWIGLLALTVTPDKSFSSGLGALSEQIDALTAAALTRTIVSGSRVAAGALDAQTQSGAAETALGVSSVNSPGMTANIQLDNGNHRLTISASLPDRAIAIIVRHVPPEYRLEHGYEIAPGTWAFHPSETLVRFLPSFSEATDTLTPYNVRSEVFAMNSEGAMQSLAAIELATGRISAGYNGAKQVAFATTGTRQKSRS